MIHPLRLYADGLMRIKDARQPAEEQQVRLRDGTRVPLPLGRYSAPADETDELLLSDLRGPVLDVGCGPGRHLHALAARGVFALGVDLSPVAVELARGRGARAIVGSVFEELPGSGTWRSALLLDGNIGIGGAPGRLLARIATLLCHRGELLVELDPPDIPTVSTLARIETRDAISSWFPWARVSVQDAGALAAAGGFHSTDPWSVDGRWFVRLRRDAPKR
jgi:SAM-dependent methyltransferase